jgi:hypothetical protein
LDTDHITEHDTLRWSVAIADGDCVVIEAALRRTFGPSSDPKYYPERKRQPRPRLPFADASNQQTTCTRKQR